jgi:hypothetical protein
MNAIQGSIHRPRSLRKLHYELCWVLQDTRAKAWDRWHGPRDSGRKLTTVHDYLRSVHAILAVANRRQFQCWVRAHAVLVSTEDTINKPKGKALLANNHHP